MARKTYDAATIANALAVVRAEGNFLRASKLLGISRSTLRAWTEGQLPEPVANESPQVFEKRQAEAGLQLSKGYREVEGLYREHLKKPEVVAKASAAQAAIVVGVMSDKATRAEGGPSARFEHGIRFRYVGPEGQRFDDDDEPLRRGQFIAADALSRVASRVLDVPALPVGTVRTKAEGTAPKN